MELKAQRLQSARSAVTVTVPAERQGAARQAHILLQHRILTDHRLVARDQHPGDVGDQA